MNMNALAGITCAKNTHFDSEPLDFAPNLIKDEKLRAGIAITAKDARSLKCKVRSNNSTRNDTIPRDGYFGDDHLAMRPAIDTSITEQEPQESQISHVECVSKSGDLKRHSILGTGAFGQVWLVSVRVERKICETPYALKIQSKDELVKSPLRAKGFVREMEIMSTLNHPFLLRPVKSFHDEKSIYMLSSYVPGGELYRRVHTQKADGLPESDARFYAACILDALSFMHRSNIIYRDLKPENILIDKHGYPIIIDFGLAKHAEEKMYTRCGSPCYMAPEVAMINVGYGIGADHWSLGCLIHEMITGETPFVGHVTELALYRAICSGYLHTNPLIEDKAEALHLVRRLLEVDPSRRLGALAGGAMDIFNHPWFDKIDFASLRDRGTSAPWVPIIKNDFDVSNFEDQNDLQDTTTPNYPIISKEDLAKVI